MKPIITKLKLSSLMFLAVAGFAPLAHSQTETEWHETHHSAEIELSRFTVVSRSHQGKAIYEEVTLPQLIDQRFAETHDFKVVEGKSDQALEFSRLSEEDRLRAANLIYHLSIAKNFFLDVMMSQEVRRLEKVVVRINFANDWNKLGQWSYDGSNSQYNTSHSLPAGKGTHVDKDPVTGEKTYTPATWKREIWFRPAKDISVSDMLAKLAEDPVAPAIRDARDAVYPSQITAELQNGFRYMFGKGFTAAQFMSASTHQLGIVAMIEGAFLLMKQVNRWLLPNHYYLDAAMIPEVIYHEFTHLALSDYLVPNVGTPVGEGMADYFAAEIAESPKLAMKIKKYAQGFGRNAKTKVKYSTQLENRNQSTSGFVLSLLWGLHDEKNGLGHDMTRKLVWAIRPRMNTFSSEIRSDLASALRIECQKICADPSRDDLILLQYFDNRFTNQ